MSDYFKFTLYEGLFQIKGAISNKGLIRDYLKLEPYEGLVQSRV